MWGFFSSEKQFLGTFIFEKENITGGTKKNQVRTQYNALKPSDFSCVMYRDRESENEKTLQNLYIYTWNKSQKFCPKYIKKTLNQ